MARYVALYESHLESLEMLTEEQAGKLLKMIAARVLGDEYPVDDPVVTTFAKVSGILSTVDRGLELAKEKEKRSKKERRKNDNDYNDINNNYNYNNNKENKEINNKEKKESDGNGTQGNYGNGLPASDPMARARVLS